MAWGVCWTAHTSEFTRARALEDRRKSKKRMAYEGLVWTCFPWIYTERIYESALSPSKATKTYSRNFRFAELRINSHFFLFFKYIDRYSLKQPFQRLRARYGE